jgi:protein ImuB
MTHPEQYACLYADEFPVQAWLHLHPALRAKPCVVMEGGPPLEQVCSLNTHARRLGLRQGMTRVEVELFPGVGILTRSQPAEAAMRSMLLACAGVFSPRMEDRSTGTALVLALDITGTEKLFGPPETLARRLLDQVQTCGIAACVTLSRNLHAAICLAKGSLRPGSIQIIAPGTEAAALAGLPLNILDLTPDQADVLALWGIRTLGMLAALPQNELIARLGQDGKRLLQLARGEHPHLFQPEEPVFTLEEHIELDMPVELLDSLLFVLGMMLDLILLRARSQLVALASVTVVLTLERGGEHLLTVRPALPSIDKPLWLKLIHLELEARSPQAAIVAVALHAEPGATSKEQRGLFSPQAPEASRLDVALARLRALVGEGNAGSPVLEDTHAPEAFRVGPFSTAAAKPAAPAIPHTRLIQRMLRPPEAVSVTLHHARPASFWFRRQRYTVEQAYGPWKCDGRWWTCTLWGQEQWDLIARNSGGPMLCCCLVHDLIDNRWQMVALYD